jgi:hypothetical protein
MPIVPDTKDWTWVLQRPFPECGFDATALSREQISPTILTNAAAWQPMIHDPIHHLHDVKRDLR